MPLNAKCINCGWLCTYPNKQTYITCIRCSQPTKYLSEKQYLKFVSKQSVKPPAQHGSMLCECGCGEKSTVLTSRGDIRHFISGHNRRDKPHTVESRKKMSNSHRNMVCTFCSNSEGNNVVRLDGALLYLCTCCKKELESTNRVVPP